MTGRIIPLTRKHLREVVTLSDKLGWDYSLKELELALHTGRLFGFHKEDGKIIATSAIFPWSGLCSLGMVMVHPGYRRIGLGRQMTIHALKVVANTPVMLVATEEGKPLYEKLGFQRVSQLHKLVTSSYLRDEAPADGYTLTPIIPEDADRILALDQHAFKGDRGSFLKLRMERSAHGFKLETNRGEITGYALSFQNPAMLVIGPVVAPGPLSALRLIHHIASSHQGRMRVDLFPDPHLTVELERSGFRIDRKPPVMMKNGDALPTRPHLYAVAAQAYG